MNKFLAVFCLAAAANAAPKADADPYLLYGGYNGLGYAGYGGYYGGYLGGYHAAPVVAAGIASVSPSASVNIAGLALPATPAIAGGYAAAGRYVANSAGVVHVAKREAGLRLMPRLIPTCSTADSDTLDTPDTDMLVSLTPDTLVWDTTTVLDTLTTPDRLQSLPLDPLTSPVLPPLLPPLWPEDMLLLDVTVPTLLVLSTVPKKSAHTTCFC